MNSRLKDIAIENNIWVIYIVIILASWYANKLEKDYFINRNNSDRVNYQRVMVRIFLVLTVVYSYFFTSSFNSLKSINEFDSYNKKRLTELSTMGSLLVLVSGIIFLYIAYKDTDISVEVAFN